MAFGYDEKQLQRAKAGPKRRGRRLLIAVIVLVVLLAAGFLAVNRMFATPNGTASDRRCFLNDFQICSDRLFRQFAEIEIFPHKKFLIEPIKECRIFSRREYYSSNSVEFSINWATDYPSFRILVIDSLKNIVHTIIKYDDVI